MNYPNLSVVIVSNGCALKTVSYHNGVFFNSLYSIDLIVSYVRVVIVWTGMFYKYYYKT